MRPSVLFLLLAGCVDNPVSELPQFAVSNPPEQQPATWLDQIVQSQLPVVDVLLVLDTSPDMAVYADVLPHLPNDVARWLRYGGVDWRLAVTTMDPADAGTLVLLGEASYLDETTFADPLDIVFDGSETEHGRAAVDAVLTENPHDFFREEAELQVLFVSNEDDDTIEPSFETFVERLDALYGKRHITMSSIVTPPGLPGEETGSSYFALTDYFGGIKWNIHNPDWLTVLDEVGIQATGLKREFVMSRMPVTEPFSLDVRVLDGSVTYVFASDTTGDPTCNDCFSFHESRNSVTFNNFVPRPGAVVEVEYVPLDAP